MESIFSIFSKFGAGPSSSHTVGPMKAAQLAMQGDGSHTVKLDRVISSMRRTGLDMATIYDETSEGGLAVNVPEC